MATIRAYTTIEQSRKLAEILPVESADMCYLPTHIGDEHHFIASLSPYSVCTKMTDVSIKYCTPCWSLAALLDVLPNNENISTNLSKGGYRISTLEYTNSWFVDYEDETNGSNNCVTSANNPVDACVAMIEKLHELNLL